MDALNPELRRWCALHLKSDVSGVIFASRKISHVLGLRLADGRQVVLKLRPSEERLSGCVQAQRYAWERGFPCPEPIVGPLPLGDLAATAETYLPGGEALADSDAPELFARALARLIATVPLSAVRGTLEPVPYWMAWDHDLAATWPPDPNVDLNARAGPEWLERAGQAVRERLRTDPVSLSDVIGHADFESQNIRWRDQELYAVDDWDSVVRRPEAVIVGMSSLMFPSTGPTNEAASISESERFLDAYQRARRALTQEETEVAWAAGVWIGAWKAKKALMYSDLSVANALAPEIEERLRRAGAA